MIGCTHAADEAPISGRRGLGVGVGLFYGLLAAAVPGVAWPAEWSVQPSVSANVGHDNNPLLTTLPHESTNVTTVTPTMHVRGRTERSNLDVGLVLNYWNYSAPQVEDVKRQILLLRSSTRTSERTELGLDGEFRRDDLRQTLFTGAGTGSEADADVGLVQRKVARHWRDLRPSWQHALSERSSVQLSYEIKDVGFTDSAGTGLVDYTNQHLAVTYSNRINPRDSIHVTTDASRYRAPDVDNTSDTARLLVGFSRAFSETSRGSFFIGASGTKADAAGNVDHANGFVLQANATERSEITRLDGTIRHDVSPSGIGQSIESSQLRMRLVRGLTSRVNFVLRATLVRNKALAGSDTGNDRRYYEVEPAFEYQWTRQLWLGASYIYRYQKFDVNPKSAMSNTVFVGVAYNWQRQFFE